MNVCPSCGTPNPVSAKFCQECGARLLPSEQATTTQPPSMPEQSAAPADAAPSPTNEESEPHTASGSDVPASTEESSESPEEQERPKKDVSGLPPSWMPTPVTLTMKPSEPHSIPASPPLPPATTTPPPAPVESDEKAEETSADSDAQPAKDVTGLPPSWMPPPVDLGAPRPIERSGVDADWKMSDPGPLPERRDRRLWLWIPVGLITAVLICCIAFFIWATTIGEDTVDGWATNAAINQTEEATGGD